MKMPMSGYSQEPVLDPLAKLFMPTEWKKQSGENYMTRLDDKGRIEFRALNLEETKTHATYSAVWYTLISIGILVALVFLFR
jgi:hypothetical protein